MGEYRRHRPNMEDKKSPKLPLDLTVHNTTCICTCTYELMKGLISAI